MSFIDGDLERLRSLPDEIHVGPWRKLWVEGEMKWWEIQENQESLEIDYEELDPEKGYLILASCRYFGCRY